MADVNCMAVFLYLIHLCVVDAQQQTLAWSILTQQVRDFKQEGTRTNAGADVGATHDDEEYRAFLSANSEKQELKELLPPYTPCPSSVVCFLCFFVA